MVDAIVTEFFDNEAFIGWVPIRFYRQESGPCVDWCYLGERRFVEPFFSSTIESCLNLPFNQMFRHQTSLDDLGRLAEMSPGIQPTGFIFHVSRCGSTLVSQTLNSLKQNLVISEPDPIDSVLRSNFHFPNVSDEQRIDWLRWIVSALGQPRNGEQDLFINFNSWSAIDLPLIRRAFPEVPCVFLYRDPLEVLASQLTQRPVHTVPGMIESSLFGLDSKEALNMSPIEYCATALASIFQSALNNADDDRCILINYEQLPDAIWSSMLNFMGVRVTEPDLAALKQAAYFYTQRPEFEFEAERHEKHLTESDPVYQISRKMLLPLYDRIETARQARRFASNC